MRTRFQQQMEDLREKLLRMGGLAELAVDRATQAYTERDLTRCQLVLENESLINAAEREIDELAFDILATQQPAAADLRFILAVTKINADLERVGDQAVNIAERVMDMIELAGRRVAGRYRSHGHRRQRHGAARPGVVRGRQSRTRPSRLEMDHVVDRMRDEAFIMLVRKMNEEPQVTQQALDALLVARNLERVADHATNISEDVIFWVLGADVRHHAQAASAAQRPERREQ